MTTHLVTVGKNFEPLKPSIFHINSLVDIMNARKKIDCLSSPNDEKLDTLLDVVKFFSEWKEQSGINKETFIPETTYEDLCWLYSSKLGICQTYLKNDKSLVLVTGLSGTDVCEHHFGHIRQGNIKPNALECKRATARGGDIGPISNIFTEKSNSNTSGSKIYRSQISTKIDRKK